MTPNDVKIVADNIDDFIEVPDGVKRLRKAVLTLAVSGKLLPQDKKEGTAEELYAKLLAKPLTESLSRKKKTSGTSPLTTNEIPFEIPKSWKWVRLGEIVSVQTGTLDANASSSDGEYPFFTCADEPLRISRYAYDCECVLLAGNGNFNVKYYKGKFEAYQRTYIIEAIDEEVFVPYIYLLVQMQTDRFKSTSLGSAMPYIRLGYITEAAVSLPPYLEQKRVVLKVEELLKQLDELDLKKHERNEVRTRLARSAMQSLGKGDSKVAFENLTELVKEPSDIKELEEALLSLAVSGKLVPPESRGSVSRDGERKLPSTSEGVSFELPALWNWAQFKDKSLLNIVDGDRGSNYPSKSEFTLEGYCLFLNTSNVRKGKFTFSKCDFITKEKDETLRKGKLIREDVVLTTRGTIGNTAYFSNDIPFDNVRINSGMVILRCDTKKIFPPYLIVFLNSSVFITQTNKLMSGSAQQQLPIRVLNEIYFPLPPLAEQKRIVKKVEEIMELINRLKEVTNNK